MTNPENLIPHRYKPGQSGNLKGKPKGTRNTKTILKELLSVLSVGKHPETKELVDYKTAIWIKAMEDALNGDKDARKEIFDRLDGKPTQSVDLTERKPDDLEKMSNTELQDAAKRIIKKLSENLDLGDSKTT